ncbi:hypothetical protein NHX12_022772 [Muraenolepis orangiensis]|uniref:Fibronectin type-III domain-containing protein n=1 Tax=Muraenolepis orangiensis TaxID=630683 RepID=A0A9Q0ENX5_9TELE|nr:hypothetical protein NHX12_022772 [Muraenolepis orangiensis]
MAGFQEVPPVTDVTLDCHNFQNILRWNYTHDESLKPRFRVDICAVTGTFDPLWVDYPDLQCDLSSFSSPDNDYFVSVTALVGLNESVSAPPDGITFSYYRSSMSSVKCSLDLPSVSVGAQPEVGVTFTFSHPSVHYRQKLVTKPKRQQRTSEDNAKVSKFEYRVVLVTPNKTEYSYSCMTKVCEDSVPAVSSAGVQPEGYCVKIDGYWEKMAVRGTQDYCVLAAPSTANSLIFKRTYRTKEKKQSYTALIQPDGLLSPVAVSLGPTFQLPADELGIIPEAPREDAAAAAAEEEVELAAPAAAEEVELAEAAAAVVAAAVAAAAVAGIVGQPPLPRQPEEGAGQVAQGVEVDVGQVAQGVEIDVGFQGGAGYEQRPIVVVAIEMGAGDIVEAYLS